MPTFTVNHYGDGAFSKSSQEEAENLLINASKDLEVDRAELSKDYGKIELKKSLIDEKGEGESIWEAPSKEALENGLNSKKMPFSSIS